MTDKSQQRQPLGTLLVDFDFLSGRRAAFWRAVARIDAMSPEMRQRHSENFYIASKVAGISQKGIKDGKYFFTAVMEGYRDLYEEFFQEGHPVFNNTSIDRWNERNPLDPNDVGVPGAAHVMHAYWRFGSHVELVSAIYEKTPAMYTFVGGAAHSLVPGILSGKITDKQLKAISYHGMDMHGLIIP